MKVVFARHDVHDVHHSQVLIDVQVDELFFVNFPPPPEPTTNYVDLIALVGREATNDVYILLQVGKTPTFNLAD